MDLALLLYSSRPFASAIACLMSRGCDDSSPPANAEAASDLPTANFHDSFASPECFESGCNRRSERVYKWAVPAIADPQPQDLWRRAACVRANGKVFIFGDDHGTQRDGMLKNHLVRSIVRQQIEHVRCFMSPIPKEMHQRRGQLRINQKPHVDRYAACNTR